MTNIERLRAVQKLKRLRRRDPVLIGAIFVVVLGMAISWATLDVEWEHPVTGQSLLDIPDGALREYVPNPLRTVDEATGEESAQWNATVLLDWMGGHLKEVGWRGISAGLAMAILAMVLAALLGWLLYLPASRNIMLQGGLLEADRDGRRVRRVILSLVWALTRGVLVVLRAIPEFVWAFLFLLVFGPSLMAGVIALALHNAGILGKLASESLEDTDPRPLRSLAGLGSSSTALATFGIGPRILPQFLVYFFYRFETCLREAAILGLLGLATLGLFIDHAFARLHLDTALCFVLFNSCLVILGDLAGSHLRARVRSRDQ